MKPLILPIPPLDKDGKIRLTPDELNDLISKAYDSGYSDGLNNRSILPYPYYPTTPEPIPTSPTWPTWPSPYVTWTCQTRATPNTTVTAFNQASTNWTEEVKKSM